MEKIMNEIFNNLLVYIQEDGTLLPIIGGNVFSNSNHQKIFNECVLGSGILNGSYDLNDNMIINANKMAENNKFLMFLNVTSYNKSDKCDSIVIYASKDLTVEQRNVVNECYDAFKKMKMVVSFVFDKDQAPIQCLLDDYIELINSENKILVK